MDIEARLVRHMREVEFADLPQAAVDSAKRVVLWTIGTASAGASVPSSRDVLAFAQEIGGRAEATVLGFGDRLPAASAGLVNGVLAKALEYEDKFWLDNAHAYTIGPAVVPAALAVAEHVGGVSGRELLAAVALASDIEARMFKSALGCIATGWNASYVFASLAAALAATRLLRLDQDPAMDALGLAYAQTAGNYQGQQEGVLGVRMMMGFGVRNGITAAQLARRGITGVHRFLTGKFGLYPLFYRDISPDLDWLTRDLGVRFFAEELGFKAYPCCAVIHSVLDAVLGLEDMPAPEQVASVQVYGTPRMRIAAEPVERRKHPATEIECQFSIPWAVACTVADRRTSLSHFSAGALADRRYRELAPRVDVHLEPDRAETQVVFHLRDGRELATPSVAIPKGHPSNPLSTEEVADRFRDCMAQSPTPLSPGRVEAIKDAVLQLDRLDDIGDLMRMLA